MQDLKNTLLVTLVQTNAIMCKISCAEVRHFQVLQFQRTLDFKTFHYSIKTRLCIGDSELHSIVTLALSLSVYCQTVL